jgi:hypothetical protein
LIELTRIEKERKEKERKEKRKKKKELSVRSDEKLRSNAVLGL